MDQKVNDSELKHNSRTPVRFRVVQSNLPGQEDTYSATVIRRDTLTIDDLIRRIMSKRSELRPETLRTVFSLIKNELYEALEDGYNVDFEFGRVDVTLGGAFVHPSDRYDADIHLLQPRLNPSPLMKQRVARLKGINDTYNASRNGLQLEYITDANLPIPSGEAGNRNIIPTDFKGMLSIYGRYIRISGDNPANGLAFHCQETGETYTVSPDELLYNTASRLIVCPSFPPHRRLMDADGHHAVFKEPPPHPSSPEGNPSLSSHRPYAGMKSLQIKPLAPYLFIYFHLTYHISTIHMERTACFT